MGSGASRSLPAPGEEQGDERRKKAAKIPLNIALVAIVKIQVRFRIRMARRRFEAMKLQIIEERRQEELARRAKIMERDELTPLKIGAKSYLNQTGRLLIENRFMRKAAQNQIDLSLETMPPVNLVAQDTESDFDIDPSMVMAKYTPYDAGRSTILPLVGFVIKSHSHSTGKKIFINICHHECIVTMVCAAVREVSDSSAAILSKDVSYSRLPGFSGSNRPFSATSASLHNANAGFLESTQMNSEEQTIQIADILLPTREFEECFQYDEDDGLLPVENVVRKELARQVIKFWNLSNQDDIVESCSFPKIKRGYFGDLLPLVLDNKYKTISHSVPTLREFNAHHDAMRPTVGEKLTSLLKPQPQESKSTFHLPFAPEVRSWIDQATVGNRVALVENALPSELSMLSSMALIEPTKALKSSCTHLLTFTSPSLPAGLVELVVPAPTASDQIPLFGPAYSAEMISAQKQSQMTSTDPAAPSTSGASIGGNTSGSSSSSAPVGAASSSTFSAHSSSSPFSPHVPSQGKSSRSATLGPGSAASSLPHRHLSAPGAAWSKSTASPAAKTTANDVVAVSIPKQDLEAAASAALDAVLLAPEVSRCNASLPVFLILSMGVLYLYNRDPLRPKYFPRSTPRPAPKEPVKPVRGGVSWVETEAEGPKPEPVLEKEQFIPLILYGRIMLTEDCVGTSTSLKDGAYQWNIYIQSPKATTAAEEDTVAALFTQFHDVFQGRCITMTMRSYSEFRTWKAHLRTHIQVGQAIRKRIVSEYSIHTLINKHAPSKKIMPKLGELKYHSNQQQKLFVKIDNGLFLVYDEKLPTEFVGHNFLEAFGLWDKSFSLRNEMLKDNSSQNILSILGPDGNLFKNYAFSFHKPYAMDESESREFQDFLQRHAHLALTRMCSYNLPMIESQHGVVVSDREHEVATVKLAVSGTEDIDSDDEDEDETEHALRKHTLLTILYLSHPFPVEEVQRKAEEALLLESSSAAALSSSPFNSLEINKSLEQKFGYMTAHPLPSHGSPVHSIAELEALDEACNLHTTYGEQPSFEIVLVGKKLYFYHSMKFYFSLDLTHCGTKSSFRAARMWEKVEIAQVKQEIVRAREKASVFYLDSSSEDEYESRSGLGSDDDFHLPLSRINSQGSLIAPSRPTSVRSGKGERRGSHPHRRRKLKKVKSRPIKTIDSAAPVVPEPDPIWTPIVRSLTPSTPPPNYPIKGYAIQLVCYDSRTYTLKFNSDDDYQLWRTLLFSAGKEVAETVFFSKYPPSASPKTALSATDLTGIVTNATDGPSKEDALQGPETTSTGDLLHATGEGNGNGGSSEATESALPAIAKVDRGFDLDATRKFARMLRKEEKVLSTGQVFKHDASPQGKSNTTTAGASGGNKQRRILVLTDAPRLLFLDPVGNIVRGALDIGNASLVDVRMSTAADFEVVIGGIVNRFTSNELPEKTAIVSALQQLCQAYA